MRDCEDCELVEETGGSAAEAKEKRLREAEESELKVSPQSWDVGAAEPAEGEEYGEKRLLVPKEDHEGCC